MNMEMIRAIIKRLEAEKKNYDTLGIRFEDDCYMALTEAINTMYKLAKATTKKLES